MIIGDIVTTMYRDMVGKTFGIFLAESSCGTLMINYTIDGASITLCL